MIHHGSEVTLHFSLALPNGNIIDQTPSKQPATLVTGDGSLPSSFEQVLFGMNAGEQRSVLMPPEAAFGHTNPNSIQVLPRQYFDASTTLTAGMMMTFNDVANSEIIGVIQQSTEHEVTVNFNHPLAGQALQFSIEIITINNPK